MKVSLSDVSIRGLDSIYLLEARAATCGTAAAAAAGPCASSLAAPSLASSTVDSPTVDSPILASPSVTAPSLSSLGNLSPDSLTVAAAALGLGGGRGALGVSGRLGAKLLGRSLAWQFNLTVAQLEASATHAPTHTPTAATPPPTPPPQPRPQPACLPTLRRLLMHGHAQRRNTTSPHTRRQVDAVTEVRLAADALGALTLGQLGSPCIFKPVRTVESMIQIVEERSQIVEDCRVYYSDRGVKAS